MRVAVDLATGEPVDQGAFARLCLSADAEVVNRVDLLLGGDLVTSGYRVMRGEVVDDRLATHRGRLSDLSVAVDVAELPIAADGRFGPGGWEVQVWGGLRMSGGSGDAAYFTPGKTIEAAVSLGIFTVESVMIDGASGLLTVEQAWDRSMFIAEDKLITAWSWPGGFATLEEAVEYLVKRTWPNVECDFSGLTHSCPSLVHERDSSPWDIIQDAAKSVGYVASFNGAGWFTWEPEPDLRSEIPSMALEVGETGIITNMSVGLDRSNTWNRWTVIGTNPSTSVEIVAVAIDDDPESPTYWSGPFKHRPKPPETMAEVDTQSKANESVNAMKLATMGIEYQISTSAVPQYLLEPGDAVTIDNEIIGMSVTAIIDSVSFPGGLGSMALSVRARREES